MHNLTPVEALQREIERAKIDVERGYASSVYVAALELAQLSEKLAAACDGVSFSSRGDTVTTTGFMELGSALMEYRAASIKLYEALQR